MISIQLLACIIFSSQSIYTAVSSSASPIIDDSEAQHPQTVYDGKTFTKKNKPKITDIQLSEIRFTLTDSCPFIIGKKHSSHKRRTIEFDIEMTIHHEKIKAGETRSTKETDRSLQYVEAEASYHNGAVPIKRLLRILSITTKEKGEASEKFLLECYEQRTGSFHLITAQRKHLRSFFCSPKRTGRFFSVEEWEVIPQARKFFIT